MKLELYRLTLIATLILGSVACDHKNSFSSSGQNYIDGLETDTDKLNWISHHPHNQLTIQFDRIDQVSELNAPNCYCPANADCLAYCPNIASATILGSGSVQYPTVTTTSSLPLAVSFDPSIKNGADCLVQAKDAYARHLWLNITGKATLVPIDWGMDIHPYGEGGSSTASSPPATPANISDVYSQATAVNAGTVEPPVFVNPWAGLVLTEITSCEEATPTYPQQDPNWDGLSEKVSCAPDAAGCTQSFDFGITMDGDVLIGEQPSGLHLSTDDFNELNAAANAVVVSFSTSPVNQCLPPTAGAAYTDTVTIDGPVAPCERGYIRCMMATIAPPAYTFDGHSACYRGDPNLVDSFRQIFTRIRQKYSVSPQYYM